MIPDGPDELHRWQISGPFQQKVAQSYRACHREEFARVPVSSSSDVDSAVLAARRAQSGWGSLSHSERADWLDIIADELESDTKILRLSESKDTGKPISLARSVDANRVGRQFQVLRGHD